MLKLVEWDPNLRLTDFYRTAEQKGFLNNSSQSAMVDCFRTESSWNVWILYQNEVAVGSVAAHTFDDVMGEDSYRILSRVCVFPEITLQDKGLVSPYKRIQTHQHVTDQYFMPACIEWAKSDKLYATSNDSKVGKQRLVHNVYFPTLEKMGVAKKVKDVFYRGINQTVWQIYPEEFYTSLNKFPKWSEQV